ncbi:MAG: rod shape-determining protein RodA [Actinomycetota bacterium]|nr:rod shape-determining protein RodA [Actinomycetota bacterium]
MTAGYGPTAAPAPTPALARESTLRRLDWPLLLGALALSGIGAVLVWSATLSNDRLTGGDPTAYLKKHLLNLAIGLVLGAVASTFDYRLLRAYAPIVYGAALTGLVAVLTPLGSTINGSHSWIVLPAGFSVQPSEFAKVAIVVGMAMILAERRDAEPVPGPVEIVLALALAAVPLGLILLQPDLGTALVVSCVVLGVLAVSGAPARWLVGLVLAGLLAVVFAVQLGVVKDYQLDRLSSFVDPSADPRGTAYNQRQAGIAIGAGRLTGQGLFSGAQTQGDFVPEQQTDFIFTVAGEELGLVGAGGILALLGVVLWRVGRVASRAEDLFGRLVATGVLCWFAFQAFENVGMALGIMPVTGVPLPFVSYGGSSMFANLIAVGLVQNVRARATA